MQGRIKKSFWITCAIMVLSLYLWGCYEVNHVVAVKMSAGELILSAIGMLCGLFIVIFIIWMINSLFTGTAYPFKIED